MLPHSVSSTPASNMELKVSSFVDIILQEKRLFSWFLEKVNKPLLALNGHVIIAPEVKVRR
jgi:hypothetical protein